MKTNFSLFKKSIIVLVAAIFGLAAIPVTSVYALGTGDNPQPPLDLTQLSDQQLQNAWARLQHIYERQGNLLDRADQLSSRIQNLIDRLNERGFDTSSLQQALDDFEAALKEAHPIFESANGIISAHKGFDADCNLTDRELAIESIQALHDKVKQIRDTVGNPFKLLREALKAFREANQPATPKNSQVPRGNQGTPFGFTFTQP